MNTKERELRNAPPRRLPILLLLIGFLCVIVVQSISRSLQPHSVVFSSVEANLTSTSSLGLFESSPWTYSPTGNRCNRYLKVYVYDLPRKFNFGLFDRKSFSRPDNEQPWNSSEYVPEWPGGNRTLKHQHSIAYYLLADLYLDRKEGQNGSMAVRVQNPEDADVFFVPFFSSASFNTFGRYSMKDHSIDEGLQIELVRFLNASKWWHRSEGRDHVIPSTHPNALRFARAALKKAIFILVDFGRYSWNTARLPKDVIVPYNHVISKYEDEDKDGEEGIFERRTTLLFFQGTVKLKQKSRVRARLFAAIKDEPGIHFVRSAPKARGFAESNQGMRTSKFCLHSSGDTASSCRLFDAIMARCVPVVVSDVLDLPFEDVIDYSQFALFVAEKDACEPGYLPNLLRNVDEEKWMAMWRNLGKVQRFFEFHKPAQPGDAVDMVWDQIYKKLPSIRLAINRRKRLVVPEWWDAPRRTKH